MHTEDVENDVDENKKKIDLGNGVFFTERELQALIEDFLKVKQEENEKSTHNDSNPSSCNTGSSSGQAVEILPVQATSDEGNNSGCGSS